MSQKQSLLVLIFGTAAYFVSSIYGPHNFLFSLAILVAGIGLHNLVFKTGPAKPEVRDFILPATGTLLLCTIKYILETVLLVSATTFFGAGIYTILILLTIALICRITIFATKIRDSLL